MSDLGKIFIYEKNLHHLHQLIADLELHGFYTFGTNNLYALIQYAKEVKPDIMVINLPFKHTLSEEDIIKIEATVCKNGCPDIYINQNIINFIFGVIINNNFQRTQNSHCTVCIFV